MSRQFVVLCGVPKESCTGGGYVTDQQLPQKAHSSHEEAFDCMKRYLRSQGYKSIGPREFAPPDGGPVRVLTKKSRYGSVLRRGKEGRYMPDVRNSGVIIG